MKICFVKKLIKLIECCSCGYSLLTWSISKMFDLAQIYGFKYFEVEGVCFKHITHIARYKLSPKLSVTGINTMYSFIMVIPN